MQQDMAHNLGHNWVRALAHSLVRSRARNWDYSQTRNRAQQLNRAWPLHWKPPPPQEWWKNQAVRQGQAVPPTMNRASCPQKATALAHQPHPPVARLRPDLKMWTAPAQMPGLKLPVGQGLRAGLQSGGWHWQPPAGLTELTGLAGLAGLAQALPR